MGRGSFRERTSAITGHYAGNMAGCKLVVELVVNLDSWSPATCSDALDLFQ
jgi:hypothetical protein